jgi:kelch motif-containing protein
MFRLFSLLVCVSSACGLAYPQSIRPTLQSLVPNSVIAGSASVAVVLNGSGFNESSIVGISGGPNMTPQFLGADTLQVVIPANLLSAPARLGLTVFNRDTNLGSDQLPFYVYSPFPPVVTSIGPSGGIRGTTLPLTLNGQNLVGATVSFSGNGIAMVPQTNGDLVIGVAADAPLGPQTVTITTPFGSTNMCGDKPCTFSAIDSGSWTDVPLSPFAPGFLPGPIIRLVDGRVLVAGGRILQPGTVTIVASSWLFDPSTNQWSPTGALNSTANEFGVASLLPDGRVLVARSDASAEIYDPATGKWSVTGSMTAGARGKALLLLNGKVLVPHNRLDRFEADLFDPATERFQALPDVSFSTPAGPVNTELLADGRVLIVVAGQENRIYDPSTGTLSNVPVFSTNGSGQWVRLLPDAHALVRGGTVIGPFTPAISSFIYDAKTNSAVAAPAGSFGGSDVLLPSGFLLINQIVIGRTPGGGFINISRPVLVEPTMGQWLPQTPVDPPTEVAVLLDDGRVFGFGKMYVPAPYTNPVPVVGSVISDSTTLDIRGVRFLSNSIVRLGQRRLVTLYLGSQRLIAFVPPALRSSLNAGITVSNPGPGGGQTESVQPGFTATVPLPISEVETGAVRSGYVIVTPDAGNTAPVATLTYGIVRDAIVQSQASILPTPLTAETAVQIDTVQAIGRNVGIAIANTSNSTATISLTLRNQDGTTATSVVTFPLFAQSQVARFVTELLPSQVVGAAFRGNLTIQSSIPVSIVGLRFSGVEFSSIPVPSTGAPNPSAAIVFPQFAISGGWATTLGLLNNTLSVVSGRVDIFDKNGRPMPVTLNGVTNSTFSYSIPPRGSLTLAPRDSNGQSPF